MILLNKKNSIGFVKPLCLTLALFLFALVQVNGQKKTTKADPEEVDVSTEVIKNKPVTKRAVDMNDPEENGIPTPITESVKPTNDSEVMISQEVDPEEIGINTQVIEELNKNSESISVKEKITDSKLIETATTTDANQDGQADNTQIMNQAKVYGLEQLETTAKIVTLKQDPQVDESSSTKKVETLKSNLKERDVKNGSSQLQENNN